MSLVSIITPNYNSARFIGETIESVLAQTYTNWELIIIDDNSTDNSLEVLEQYQDHPKIRIISNSVNSGAAICRNQAIEIAKGRFIAFLDSDDVWYPEKLEKQINFMHNNQHVFTYTAYDKINEQGNEIGHIDIPLKLNYQDLLKTCSIGCLTAIYDTNKLGKVYMPDIRKRQDYGLWLKILKQEKFAYGINTSLAKYRVRNNSISSNKLKAAGYQWKIYRDVEDLSLIKSFILMIHYTFHGVIKSFLK